VVWTHAGLMILPGIIRRMNTFASLLDPILRVDKILWAMVLSTGPVMLAGAWRSRNKPA